MGLGACVCELLCELLQTLSASAAACEVEFSGVVGKRAG